MTITRDWLQQKIAAMEEARDEIPIGLDEDERNTLEALLIALASLEAEPVAWRWSYGGSTNWRHQDSEPSIGDNKKCPRVIQALYTTPPSPVVPAEIDARMKAAGMLSAADILAGQPMDSFMKHSGVVDVESLLKWAEMRRAEFLRMQAGYELGDKEKDDLYEWVISHVAVFSELHVNIRAAMQGKADGTLTNEGTMPVGNSPVIPDGWVMVPVVPTWDMLSENGCKEHHSGQECSHHDNRRRIWLAMLAAAPQQEAE